MSVTRYPIRFVIEAKLSSNTIVEEYSFFLVFLFFLAMVIP